MYKRPTVFVIGAGCSHELGLPLGPKLVDAIYEVLTDVEAKGYNIIEQAHLHCGLPGNNINVQSRFKTFAKGLHGHPSIDQYLNYHKADELFVAIGKAAIAYVILREERNSVLRRSSLEKGLQPIANTWITKLFHAFIQECDPNNLENVFDNISFVCFNYDRCIEIALANLLRLSAGLSPEQLAAIMNRLHVFHPYGDLGIPNYADWNLFSEVTGFGEVREIDSILVASAAKRLRTFTEGLDKEVEIKKIHDHLADAKRIVYLGYSFLPQNMEILKVATKHASSHVYATTYRLSDSDVEIASRSIVDASPLPEGSSRYRLDSVHTYSVKASDFIDSFGNMLRR